MTQFDPALRWLRRSRRSALLCPCKLGCVSQAGFLDTTGGGRRTARNGYRSFAGGISCLWNLRELLAQQKFFVGRREVKPPARLVDKLWSPGSLFRQPGDRRAAKLRLSAGGVVEASRLPDFLAVQADRWPPAFVEQERGRMVERPPQHHSAWAPHSRSAETKCQPGMTPTGAATNGTIFCLILSGVAISRRRNPRALRNLSIRSGARPNFSVSPPSWSSLRRASISPCS